DNDINRLLAVKILERLGYQIVAVSNGKEAFERLRQQDFDLVLMDIQMPEWDGLEATRQIRSGIPPGRQPVIVAMTAFAGTEDRDACSQAGMDDYVSKPITTNDLENTLRKWSGHARSLQPGVPLPSAPEEQDVARIDREAVQRLMDIARQSDPGFIQQVMELFEKQAPVVLNDLRDAVVKMDLTAVWKSAHKLKGTCVNLGAGKMASICKELEKKGRNFEGTGLMPLVQRLEQEYEATSRELREMLQYN
ncbi:MAG: response regulator, partial [Bacteroidota bacterium]